MGKQLQQETKFITSNNIWGEVISHGLKLGERFLGGGALGHLQSVELDRLGQRPTLSDSDDISELDISEAGREMDRHVLVSLLEPVVLLHVVEIVTPDNHGPVHLHLGDDSGQDPSTDRNLSSEGTLLVNVTSVFGLIGDLEAEAGIAEEPSFRWLQSSLLVEEDGGLLLEGPFVLFGHGWISCRSESSNISLVVGCCEF